MIQPEDLRAARKQAGYTQRTLAEALGVDRQTVYRWERGMHPVTGPALTLLRLVLGDALDIQSTSRRLMSTGEPEVGASTTE